MRDGERQGHAVMAVVDPDRDHRLTAPTGGRRDATRRPASEAATPSSRRQASVSWSTDVSSTRSGCRFGDLGDARALAAAIGDQPHRGIDQGLPCPGLTPVQPAGSRHTACRSHLRHRCPPISPDDRVTVGGPPPHAEAGRAAGHPFLE